MGLFSSIFGNRREQSAIGKQIKLRAEEFVITYGVHYKGLDYSVQSINVLDRLLCDITPNWGEMSADIKHEVITNASSYVLWVIKQQCGGSFYWSEQRLQPVLVIGEPNYRVALMAQDRVKNKVEKTDAPGIILLYRQVMDELQAAVSTTDILLS